MTPEERKVYWATEIAFDCPLTHKRHPLDYCFKNCEMWGKQYKTHEGKIQAYLFCHGVTGERELHNGKPTRDN